MLSFVDCAKRGRPTGGKKDSIPPIIIKSSPENYSTHFDGDEIRIYFDEYIKFKNLNSQLIISPPLKYAPTITPLSTSKYIKIKILDTLRDNTTYSINFGKSIEDNNEGNSFEYFKYVFSTGDYIDSLKLKGTVKDSKKIKLETPVSVMLYEVNEAYHDSILLTEKPMYITTVKDSTDTFELTNIKEGNYRLIALKEDGSDYIFQPEKDKVAFINEFITIPTDSTYQLTLFKEAPEYSISRPKHVTKNHIEFGYEGNADSLKLTLLTKIDTVFNYKKYHDRKKDTIHYWFKPSLEVDTLQFTAINKTQVDTVNVKFRNLFKDSLKISIVGQSFLKLEDSLKVFANTPLVAADSDKIRVMDKDSVIIPAYVILDPRYNNAAIIFDKTEEQTYSVEILPGAFTDFFEKVNDTLNYRGNTKALGDYGNLTITLENAKKYPIIVELVDDKYKEIAQDYLTSKKEVSFNTLTPGKYYIRIVYDDNENGIWDTGNVLKGIQPEKILYYPSLIDIKANWDLIETFNLK